MRGLVGGVVGGLGLNNTVGGVGATVGGGTLGGVGNGVGRVAIELVRTDETRGTLREKSVPRMDERGLGLARRGDEPVDREIRLARRSGTEPDRGIRFAHERQRGIGVGVRGDGSHSKASRRPDDPTRDLAAVRDEECRHQLGLRRSRNARRPS